MSNPFRAALGLLEMHNDGSWDDLGSAIRILEAAGGVDKARLISLINESELRHALMGGGAADPQMYAIDADAESQLRALLSALPDKEKP